MADRRHKAFRGYVMSLECGCESAVLTQLKTKMGRNGNLAFVRLVARKQSGRARACGTCGIGLEATRLDSQRRIAAYALASRENEGCS